jgi:hypothetical protein
MRYRLESADGSHCLSVSEIKEPEPMTATAQSRGWGPFTGRQLTAIIITLTVGLVMVPGTVWAVDTFTNVAIQDPVTGAKASIDVAHRVLVNGVVTAIPRPPTTPFYFSENVTLGVGKTLVGPTASQINLTALAVSPYGGTAGPVDFYLHAEQVPNSATTCPGINLGTPFHIGAMQRSPVFVQTFPTPLALRPVPGTKMCLSATIYAGSNVSDVWVVNGSGFTGS